MSADPTESARALIASSSVLVFVCSGNVLRSAFGDLLARHLQLPFERIVSCATTYQNSAIFPESKAALIQRGVPAAMCDAHVPRLTTDSSFVRDVGDPAKAVFLCMTKGHMQSMPKAWQPRSVLILELLGRRNEDIADPYFDGNYEEAFRDIDACVRMIGRLSTK